MSFIKDVLSFIEEVGELIPEHKGNYRNLAWRNRPTYYKSLERLERKKFVKKILAKNKQIAYIITPLGKQVLHRDLKKTPRKDGLATLITYDIPADKNRERTMFRRYLLRNGFTLIQRSLLISPNKFDDHLTYIMKELKIVPYVKVVSGKFDYFKLH